MKEKAGRLFENLYKYIITGIFWPVVLLLAVFAAFSTSVVNMEIQVRTFYVSDNILINILTVALVTAVCCVFMKIPPLQKFAGRINTDEAFFIKWRRILLAVIVSMAVIWVLATQYIPQYDQQYLQDAVYSLHIGESKIFSPGEYIDKYPQQLGLVWIYYLISLVCGARNYICLQIINALFLGLFYRELSEICRKLKFSHMTNLMVVAVGILFFPLIIYSSYIYGNIMGLALAVLAIRHEFEFFENYKIKNAAAASLSIALAACIKSNYLIFMIGMAIYAAMKILKEQKPVILLLPVFMIITYMVQSNLPLALAQQVTGQPLDQGSSSLSWIAMGLHNDEKNPGWYDYYNWDSYDESGFDKQKHAEMATEDIEKSIEYYKNNPEIFSEFLTEKILSQWNNPDFQCFWTFQNTPVAGIPAGWTLDVMSAAGTYYGVQFMNILQFIILAGTLLYCVLCWKDGKFTDSLILAMIFIGGFLFHIMWEAKAQYVISFFVLLIPYCVAGFGKLAEILLNIKERKIKVAPVEIIKTPFVIMGIIAIAFFISGYTGDKGSYLTEDDSQYHSYLQQKNVSSPVEDGRYSFTTAGGYILSHSIQDGYYVPVAHLADTADENCEIQLTNYQQDTWLRFTASNTLLSYTEDGDPQRQTVMAIENELRDSQKWKVEDAGGGMVYIRYEKQYLTYDEETMAVYTSPYNNMENQKWTVEKI